MNAIITRRNILKGTGSLVVAMTLPGSVLAQAAAKGKTVDPKQVDAYLALHADGTATIYSGKVDLGTHAENDRFCPVVGLRDDLEIRLPLDDAFQPIANDRVIVGEEHPNGHDGSPVTTVITVPP